MEKFKKRAVKYLGIIKFDDWQFKLYSMKYDELRATPEIEKIIRGALPDWIRENSQMNDFTNYKIGTVIVHEAMDSILVVVNWWVYENVIQNRVYCSEYEHPDEFVDITSKGLRVLRLGNEHIMAREKFMGRTYLKEVRQPGLGFISKSLL